MNEEKKNQEYYQETFREVHAPQGLAERLMDMEEMKNRKKSGSVARWVAVAAVAAVVLFAGSNGVAYATTGSTWVETLVYKLTLRNVEYDVELKEWKQGNGESFYNGIFLEENGDQSYLLLDDDGKEIVFYDLQTCVRQSEDRIYLVDEDYLEIDITEELQKNGYAEGSYEKNGSTKEYKVSNENGALVLTVKITYQDGSKKQYLRVFEDLDVKPGTGHSSGGAGIEPTEAPEPINYYLN